MQHKIVHYPSSEADKFESLFETSEGQLVGNFDCDILHKIFYCESCHVEIEQKTLFTYEDMMKKINKILYLNNQKFKLDIMYLLDDDTLVINANNPLKIKETFVSINKLGKIYRYKIFKSDYKEYYTEEKYFFQTLGYNKVIKEIR